MLRNVSKFDKNTPDVADPLYTATDWQKSNMPHHKVQWSNHFNKLHARILLKPDDQATKQ